MDIQQTKNTLSIDYEYDKLNNVGQFALTYRKDNKTVKINENDSVSIYYFKEGKGDLHLVSNPKIVGGEVKFDQASMGDSLSSGVYDIYSTIGGEIYPSQGYVKIKLETRVENGVQVTILTGPKGDAGEAGQPGKDAPKITNVNYQDGNLIFTLSDSSSISTPLTLPTGPKGDAGEAGQPGKDAPKITNVNYQNNQLVFTLSDGTNVSTPLVLPVGPKGDAGEAGKDAPKFTNVNYQNGQLIFTLSDNSTISTPLVLPVGQKGEPGEKGSDGLSAYQVAVKNGFKGSEQEWLMSLKGQKGDPGEVGQAGKDAPKVASVNYQKDQLIFTLSDNSTISTPLVLPVGPKGESGKDAPKIVSVSLNNNVLTFTLSDLTRYNVTLPLLKSEAGQAGKDAPKFTNVNYQNGQLIFTLSDNSTISTPLVLPVGQKGEPGEKGSDGLSAYQVAVKNGFKGSESEWLTSLKGPQGPAGKDGGGSKLKRVYYDSIRKKAVFLNDDNTSIESSIFSDTNLPANPNNLTNAYLTPDPNQKPSLLLPGEPDLKIPISYNMNRESPTSTGSSLNSIDLHLNTYPLTTILVNSLQLNNLQDVLNNARNLRFNLQSACLSDDKHTLYAVVNLYPLSDNNKIYQPVFNFYKEPWHKRIDGLSFASLIGFDNNTDGKTPIDSVGSGKIALFGYESFTFLNIYGINLIVFHADSFKPAVYKPDFSHWNLESGTVTPINVDFTMDV